MVIWLWLICGILTVLVLLLLVRICRMKKSIEEIGMDFSDRLKTDTNSLIDISCRDKSIRRLASAINVQLQILRKERHRFLQGDAELKEAITNISHDLRTPLTAICGYLNLLEQEEMGTDARRYLDIITERTEHLRVLTEEFFRYSVIVSLEENLVCEELVLNSALEECIASFYGEFKRMGIEPRISLPSVKIKRRLNANALNRILGNIISNALKYSDGTLMLVMTKTGRITFSNPAKKLDAISVERLFDRFFTVESGRKSTGLGLSIAKIYTERMGGSIEASCQNGIFSVSIEFQESC